MDNPDEIVFESEVVDSKTKKVIGRMETRMLITAYHTDDDGVKIIDDVDIIDVTLLPKETA